MLIDAHAHSHHSRGQAFSSPTEMVPAGDGCRVRVAGFRNLTSQEEVQVSGA